MVGLALLLSPLKLLQALHDRPIRQAFLVLDCRHTVLLRIDMLPATGIISILGRVDGELVPKTIVGNICCIRIRLDNGSAWRDQIKIASLDLFAKGLYLTLPFVQEL